MKITKILSWSSYLSLAVMVLTVLSLVYTWGEVAKADKNEMLTQKISKEIYELIILRDDYLRYQTERSRKQFQAKTEKLLQLLQLASESFKLPGEQQLLAELQKNVQGKVFLFTQIVENRRREQSGVREKNSSWELEKRLVGQMGLKAYELRDSGNRLSEAAQKIVTAANHKAILCLCLFIALLGTASLGSSWTINKIFRQRLENLSLGTKILGSGNLDYRFPLTGNDELSELARLINGMTGNLQESYTSVENLQREIKDRLQAEEELRLSEEKFRLIAETIQDVFWISSPQSGDIFYVSPAYEKMWGRTRETLYAYPLSYSEGIHADDRERVLNNHYQGRTLGIPWNQDYRLLRPDDTVIWIQDRGFPIKDDRGNIILISGISTDITARKSAEEDKNKLEAQLAQAQKMEAIGTLAGGIAHDFNNILGIMIGYTEMSLMGIDKDSQIAKNLQEVLKAGRRAKELVKQILTFSRRREEEHKPLLVGPVIKEAVKMLRASLPATIDIRTDIQSEAIIMADPTQIHQIMMNLCTNAAHAMEEKGGILTISLHDIDFEVSPPAAELSPGPYIKLSISDNGLGMPPDVLSQIFNPFFTTKGVGKGTGLGLSVVYGIVKNHCGAITVESEPGKGSIFDVFFLRTKVQPKAEPDMAMQPPRGNEQILVVDDEPGLVDAVQQILENLGYRVEGRSNSLEALKTFESEPERFDLIITDQTMPNLTGTQLAQELMRRRPDIPVILCTGFSKLMTSEKVQEIGIRAMLMKPVVMGELATTVRQVLDSSKG